MFVLNSSRTNAHQLACHHHHSRCAHQTPTQAQTTNPTCHLHTLPAVILRTLYSTVERTYQGSCHRIYHRSIPESRHPSHSDIDIIIDCFSVNHGLPEEWYLHPVRRGLLTSQSQLLAKIPPILAFFNNAPVT